MRREIKNQQPVPSVEDDDAWMGNAYFTYRPLSNLPTPPPSSRGSSAAQSPKMTLEDGEELQAKFKGSSWHTRPASMNAREIANMMSDSQARQFILSTSSPQPPRRWPFHPTTWSRPCSLGLNSPSRLSP